MCHLQVLCKPKILPLKSVTLEKLEEMEARMNEAAKRNAPGTATGSSL
jgi:maleate cis-trans isomerase